MKRFVGDRTRHDRDSKSVQGETPPWTATAANHDQQETHHRERESREEKSTARLEHMMTRKWVSSLEQTNKALIFQIASGKFSRGIAPRCTGFDVCSEQKSARQSSGMTPAKNKSRNQRHAVQEPHLDNANQTITCGGKEQQSQREQGRQHSSTEITVGQHCQAGREHCNFEP